MNRRTHLALIEQLLMLVVFALAAALCVQAFVRADQRSQAAADRDRALIEAQNAAEALKGGDQDYFASKDAAANGNDGYYIAYNADWQAVQPESGSDPSVAYHLWTFSDESGSEYLWTASVQVYTADGELLASLPVAGQNEVSQ